MIGYDTVVRLLDPKYYAVPISEMLAEIRALRCKVRAWSGEEGETHVGMKCLVAFEHRARHEQICHETVFWCE